jgi:hypothetical protein
LAEKSVQKLVSAVTGYCICSCFDLKHWIKLNSWIQFMPFAFVFTSAFFSPSFAGFMGHADEHLCMTSKI